jgi:hypothetical protein
MAPPGTCQFVIPRDPPEEELSGFWGSFNTTQVKSTEVRVDMGANYSWTVEGCGPVSWMEGSWLAYWDVRAADGTNITFEPS